MSRTALYVSIMKTSQCAEGFGALKRTPEVVIYTSL